VVKERETILFVVNPFAGIGNISKLSNRIYKSLRNSRYSALVVVADETTDLQTLIQGHLNSGCNKVFAVGGNAAVSKVATHLVNTHASLGIVPVGSGNGLARHLRIPLDVDKAIKLVHRQKIAMIDYGLANSTPFFCIAGLGFDADMAIRFNSLTKRNFWNYALATISELSRAKAKLYRINNNGHKIHKEAFSISVANATRYGHNAIIAPDADTADGFLDVTIISPFPKFFAPSIATKLFNGKISKSRYVEIFRVSHLEIEPEDTAGAMHLDGITMVTGSSVEFAIKPLGLKVYVP
jgi:YegS/Rv2252/BmrU family lipid kinase